MHLMKNHAQLGQSERGILHLAPERSQWHSQQSSHLEKKKRGVEVDVLTFSWIFILGFDLRIYYIFLSFLHV